MTYIKTKQAKVLEEESQIPNKTFCVIWKNWNKVREEENLRS